MAEKTILLEDHKKAIADLKAQHAEALKNEKAAASEKLKALGQQLSDGNKLVKNLQSELAKATTAKPEDKSKKAEPRKKTPLSTETFTHNGVKYGFAIPAVKFDGKRITAADVLASEDLQAKLVEMDSGFIVKKP